jgi:hypothetical protein
MLNCVELRFPSKSLFFIRRCSSTTEFSACLFFNRTRRTESVLSLPKDVLTCPDERSSGGLLLAFSKKKNRFTGTEKR